MKRYELINWLIQNYGYTSYLEIGIDNPSNCHHKIDLPEECKTGVDPFKGHMNPPKFYALTSDDFFEQNDRTFDIVFVDGLHLGEQMARDVRNSLAVLNENGTIVCHDCNPYNSRLGGAERIPGLSWYGTVWQGWADLRSTEPDLYMRVILEDCGMGVIRRGSQKLYAGPYSTWGEWFDNRNEIQLPIDAGKLQAELST